MKIENPAEKDRRIAEVIEDIMSLKDEPESKKIRENCVMINFIANQMQGEKPYYTILYYDKRDNNYHEGFGSYDHEIVNAYKEAYFDHWNGDYFVNQIEKLEDKHWEECRQIALYDDELKALKNSLNYVADLYRDLKDKIYNEILASKCDVWPCRGLKNCKNFDCGRHNDLAIVNGDRWYEEVKDNRWYKEHCEKKELGDEG